MVYIKKYLNHNFPNKSSFRFYVFYFEGGFLPQKVYPFLHQIHFLFFAQLDGTMFSSSLLSFGLEGLSIYYPLT